MSPDLLGDIKIRDVLYTNLTALICFEAAHMHELCVGGSMCVTVFRTVLSANLWH